VWLTLLDIFPCVSLQGGLLTGADPSAFNTADPLKLWIIQVGPSLDLHSTSWKTKVY